MNFPFELQHSTSLSSCNYDKSKFDVRSASTSNAFLSTPPPEDPPTYDTHHAKGLADRNPATPTGLDNLSGHPYLMATICTSSIQSGNRLTGAVPSKKRNAKMIERQRRRAMTTLCSKLRSLLPDENLRGKRSVSDQLEAAVNYILQLQQKIEDLSRERDKMKAKVDSERNAKVEFSCKQFFHKSPLVQGADGDQFPAVEIKSVGSGVQISTKTFQHQNVYSDHLQALEEAGVEVFSAAFFGINDNKVFNTIHTKVHDLNAFKIEILYEKLWHLVSNGQSRSVDHWD